MNSRLVITGTGDDEVQLECNDKTLAGPYVHTRVWLDDFYLQTKRQPFVTYWRGARIVLDSFSRVTFVTFVKRLLFITSLFSGFLATSGWQAKQTCAKKRKTAHLRVPALQGGWLEEPRVIRKQSTSLRKWPCTVSATCRCEMRLTFRRGLPCNPWRTVCHQASNCAVRCTLNQVTQQFSIQQVYTRRRDERTTRKNESN